METQSNSTLLRPWCAFVILPLQLFLQINNKITGLLFHLDSYRDIDNYLSKTHCYLQLNEVSKKNSISNGNSINKLNNQQKNQTSAPTLRQTKSKIHPHRSLDNWKTPSKDSTPTPTAPTCSAVPPGPKPPPPAKHVKIALRDKTTNASSRASNVGHLPNATLDTAMENNSAICTVSWPGAIWRLLVSVLRLRGDTSI